MGGRLPRAPQLPAHLSCVILNLAAFIARGLRLHQEVLLYTIPDARVYINRRSEGRSQEAELTCFCATTFAGKARGKFAGLVKTELLDTAALLECMCHACLQVGGGRSDRIGAGKPLQRKPNTLGRKNVFIEAWHAMLPVHKIDEQTKNIGQMCSPWPRGRKRTQRRRVRTKFAGLVKNELLDTATLLNCTCHACLLKGGGCDNSMTTHKRRNATSKQPNTLARR